MMVVARRDPGSALVVAAAAGAASEEPSSPSWATSSSASSSSATSSSSSEPGGAEPDEEAAAAAAEPQDAGVGRHFEEVLVRNFHCLILFFSVALCLLFPTMLVIQIWLVLEYLKFRKVRCDVPLQTWTLMVFFIMLFNATVNKPSPTGSLGQRLFCRWSRDPGNPRPMPCRVRLYNFLVMLIVSAWNVVGLYWVAASGGHHHQPEGEGLKPCRQEAPGLYHAVQVYAFFNLALMAFMYVHTIGLAHMLHIAMVRGLLHTQEAAPDGAMEANTEALEEGDPLLAEHPACPVCLEDLASGARVTKGCGHVFHEQCLQGWLRVNRTCPLCRHDLGGVPP